MIQSTIDINRSPVEVFAYIEQLEKHSEWQPEIISGHKEPPGPTKLGTLNTELRRVPGGPREIVSKVTEYKPPVRIAARGLNGPIRANVAINVAPIENGTRSRVTQELEFESHGIGKLFAFFAKRSAPAQMSKNLARLKDILERG